MRLFLSPKEADLVLDCLVTAPVSAEKKHMIKVIIDRIKLCTELQDNENKSKK